MAGRQPRVRGDSFRLDAQTYNDLVRNLARRDAAGSRGGLVDRRQLLWVKARGNAVVDLPAFSAVSLDGVVFAPDDDANPGTVDSFVSEPVLEAYVPAASHGEAWGILLDPLPVGGYVARVMVLGVAPVVVRGPDSSSAVGWTEGVATHLTTGQGDGKVLWQESLGEGEDETTTDRRALVLLGGGAAPCPSTNCIQQWALAGPPTGGTWTPTLTIDGTDYTTAGPLDFNIAAADIQTALRDALSSFGSAVVDVTGGPIHQATVRVEFKNELGNKQILLPEIDYSTLNGFGIAPVVRFNQIGRA